MPETTVEADDINGLQTIMIASLSLKNTFPAMAPYDEVDISSDAMLYDLAPWFERNAVMIEIFSPNMSWRTTG